MLALMTNIMQFAYWNCKQKRKKFPTHWGKFQPVYILLLATVLVLAQPCCMLYIGSWICDGAFSADQIDTTNTSTASGHFDENGTFWWNNKNVSALPAEQRPEWFLFPKGHYYSDGCKPEQKNFFFDGGDSNAIVPNTTVGWCIQILGTYLGFIVMFVGVCQATLLHQKVAAKWNALRRRPVATN